MNRRFPYWRAALRNGPDIRRNSFCVNRLEFCNRFLRGKFPPGRGPFVISVSPATVCAIIPGSRVVRSARSFSLACPEMHATLGWLEDLCARAALDAAGGRCQVFDRRRVPIWRDAATERFCGPDVSDLTRLSWPNKPSASPFLQVARNNRPSRRPGRIGAAGKVFIRPDRRSGAGVL